MTTIERQLAEHVGPIAQYLLRSAVRKADTVEALCRTLAANIDNPAGRERFQAEVKVRLAGTATRAGLKTGGGAAVSLPDADLQRAQTELARAVGPLARVLVKRAAPGCLDLPQLWQRLAQHVEDPRSRAAFLKAL